MDQFVWLTDMEQYQGRVMWSCASMAGGGWCVPTHGTIEMLLLCAESLGTHHLVSQEFEPLKARVTELMIDKIIFINNFRI